ncbi:DUF317 domain-containing protein [Kitasatospora sp. NPDC052896]|uniref:DUF317 domain-containing protein n=1 Tax=Kitasatospora sp. NPDC052896 TaxID=3364061 RepID=UPI0037C701B2
MTASATLAHYTPQDRDRLVSDHCAEHVLLLLDALGWTVVQTPEANFHATSPDTRLYLAWLPEDPGAWVRGIVWRLEVTPREGQPWTQEFSIDAPSEAVAAFLATLTG